MHPTVQREDAASLGRPTDRVKQFPFHHDCERAIAAPARVLFDHLDDHKNLSAHMSRPSWMMAGARMEIGFDAAQGRSVGSRISLAGRVLGVRLFVEEIVTEHKPPMRKVWETIGEPRLLVIGRYRMGFEITPRGPSSQLRVFIDYDLPRTRIGRWLGRTLGGFYARWCTERMADDAAAFFAVEASPPIEAPGS